MYDSQDSSKFNYRWTQARPKLESTMPDIHCNGRPCKTRNWRDSRDSNANMAFKWSRCSEFVLSQLDDDYLIAKGCVSMPDQDIEDWRQFKTTFNRYRRRWEQSTGYKMAIAAKQHITIKRGLVDGYKDDMHYDYVAFTDAPLTISEVRELILTWIKKSGGNRERSACKEIQDRSADNLQRITDYNFKSPNTKTIKEKFLRFCPMPATSLPVTWVMGDFWGCKTQIFEATVYWNDELIAKERKLSPMDQVWLSWIKSVCGDGIPRFTTEDHRIAVMADKLAQAEFSWDAFLNSGPDIDDDGADRPITYTVRNSDISTSKNPRSISENAANNGTKQDPTNDPSKNTLQPFDEQPAICFDGYALQPADDGKFHLRVGKSGKFFDPEAILGDDFHMITGTFRLDQVKHIVTGLGHQFHPDRQQWKKVSIVKDWIHAKLKHRQGLRQTKCEAK